MRLGYSLQWVNEAQGSVVASTGADPLGYNQNLPTGSGLSHNLGFAMTLPVSYLPQLDVVLRNILGVHYSSFAISPLTTNANGTPPDEPMTIDASVSIQPKLGSGTTMNMVAELRDATNQSGESLLDRGVAGVEVNIRNSFFIRGGYGSGYPSAGFGSRRNGGEFSFAWYSENIGVPGTPTRDVRFVLQFQNRIF